MNSLDKIFQSTIDLSFNKGVNGSATAKIARNAGVANGTLFHHFPTKRDLIHFCYIRIQEDYVWNMIHFLDIPEKATKKQLKKAIKTSIDYWVRNPKYFSFVQGVNHSQFYDYDLEVKINKLQLSLEHAVDQAFRNNVIRRFDKKVLIELLFDVIYSIASLIIKTSDDFQRGQYRKEGFSFIWSAIRPN